MRPNGENRNFVGGEAGSFPTLDKTLLYEHWWRPERDPKAGIVLVHGLAEHSGRYYPFIRTLLDHGYAVDTFDLRGHGQSKGIPVFVRAFDEYLSDLDVFLDRVRARLPGKPVFLVGCSMGGGIVSLYSILHSPQVRGVILIGPTVRINQSLSPLLQKLSGVVGRFFPHLKMLKINHRLVSRDQAVQEAYDRDPLVYRSGLKARLGAELIRSTERIQAQVQDFSFPVLLLQGGGDKLVDPEAIQWFYDSISSVDRTLKVYEGLYHEVLNEPEKDLVEQDVLSWLDSHVRSDDR
jgi:alpha-beta hydrolase superfamily lysophospholipase